MQIDLGSIYDDAALRCESEIAQLRQDAETKRAQMKIAPVDWQLVLLNEAMILDKKASCLETLVEDLNSTATAYREPS